jgi:serine/threonine protein kinase
MSAEPSLVDQVLDKKYRIDRRLGQGGMGAVYLATHIGTGRPVALKVIFPQLMVNEEFVERFRREARAAGLLRHPNIVDVTDFGFSQLGADRIAYLVMEYLDGVSLAEVLRQEKELPLSWVVDIIEQVCLGIDKAHSQGIVHRDLKPDNIWLEPNDRGGHTVKILDFGIAHLLSSEPVLSEDECATLVLTSAELGAESLTTPRSARILRASTPPATSGPGRAAAAVLTESSKSVPTPPEGELTQAGAVLGTPRYMSPEQCLGQHVDARSDVYSIGVIAYEMLASEPPFKGSLHALIAQHVQGVPVPLIEKRPDVPRPVSSVVMLALSKNPADRPQNAIAFSSALRARTEGVSFLFRQALALYSEHFSTFIRIAVVACLPLIALSLLELLNLIPGYQKSFPAYIVLTARKILSLPCYMAAQIMCAAAFVPFVAQLLIAPLRPVRLGPAFAAVRKRLRPFLFASLRFTLLAFFVEILGLSVSVVYVLAIQALAHGDWKNAFRDLTGSVVVLIPLGFGFWALINNSLYSAIVMMEGLGGKALRVRGRQLVGRSRGAVIKLFAACALPLAVPGVIYIVLQGMHQAPGVLIPVQNTGTIVLTFLGTIALYAIYILIIPILAMTLALLYFKLRRMNGASIKAVLDPYEKEFMPVMDWLSRRNEDLHIQIHSRR